MNKTLVIGVGGTGLAAIREIRRLIAEKYEQGLQASQVSSVKFIYIDTHESDIGQLSWSVLGKDIRLTEGEKVIITGDRLQSIVDNPDEYDDVRHWLPPIKKYIGDPGSGAKGIRPYGRLIYEYNENKSKVKAKIFDFYNSLNQSVIEPNWRFYLISGLSGGTGSGMFLPLSFDLKRWEVYEKGTTFNKFYSFLIMPTLQIVGMHNRYHPNAYAALRELNYYAFQPEGLPYDNCYLLEPQNANNLEIGQKNLPLLIAQRIFLNIHSGEAAKFTDTVMDNPQLGNLEEDDLETGRRHSLRFSTFGLATVSYSKEVVAQCLAYHFSKEILSAWVEEKNYQQNINQQVRDELKNMRLSRAHICGDADPFGSKDFLDYAIEINNLVDETLLNIAKKQLGNNADKVRRSIQEGFRDVGIKEFYSQRGKDVLGAVEQSLQQIRLKITVFLRNSQFGVTYCKKFLEELINILREFQNEFSTMTGEQKDKQIRIFSDNLTDTVNSIRNNEQSFMYTNGAFQKDRANLSDELKDYLKSLASFQSGKYGLAFLNEITQHIQNLRNDLELWGSRVTDLQQSLAGKLKKILEDIKKGSKENGKSIFSESSLDQIVSKIDFYVIQNSLEEIIQARLGENSLDLITLINKANFEEVIYESSYQWVLNENKIVNVQGITLYDKFISEYPNPVQRQDILKNAKNLSAPFLLFDPGEVAKRPIQSQDVDVTTIPDAIGRITRNEQPAQKVIQQDLEAIGVPSTDIKKAEDQERIIFLQEKQAFPLRLIKSLSSLKKSYEKFAEKAALHIDRTIEPYLYELYLLSAEDIKNILKAEEVFIISRIYDLITLKVNQYNRKDEIRYEFEEPGKIGIQKLVLGDDWDSAFEVFVKDATLPVAADKQVRNARELLIIKVQHIRQKAQAESGLLGEIQQKFNQYLQEREKEYPGCTDDPRYEKAQKIINRIVSSLREEGER